MLRTIAGRALIIAVLWVTGAPIFAHHSLSTHYHMDIEVIVTGTLKEVDFRNPHSQLVLEVVEEDGTVVEWLAEGNDRNALVRHGFDFSDFEVGQEVTVVGRKNRRLRHVVYLIRVITPDGTVHTVPRTAFTDVQ